MADTTNSDVMKAYPQMTKDFPGQVQCIFLRNTSATDDGNRFPYDTSGFEGLDKNSYMFFTVPVRSYPPFLAFCEHRPWRVCIGDLQRAVC